MISGLGWLVITVVGLLATVVIVVAVAVGKVMLFVCVVIAAATVVVEVVLFMPAEAAVVPLLDWFMPLLFDDDFPSVFDFNVLLLLFVLVVSLKLVFELFWFGPRYSWNISTFLLFEADVTPELPWPDDDDVDEDLPDDDDADDDEIVDIEDDDLIFREFDPIIKKIITSKKKSQN